MDGTVIVALIAFAGSALGTFGGIITSSKLTSYRIEQLEKKVDKHNTVIERMYVVEGTVRELQNDMKSVEARLK